MATRIVLHNGDHVDVDLDDPAAIAVRLKTATASGALVDFTKAGSGKDIWLNPRYVVSVAPRDEWQT
jgi:hypothetical protein